MDISFDAIKNARNIAIRGLNFQQVAAFDFDGAKFWQDMHQAYSEPRIVALGYLEDRLHVLVFCETAHGIRVISFRKSNTREGAKHGFALARDRR